MEFRAFPSIDQFRHVVGLIEHKSTYVGQGPDDQPVYDQTRIRPTLIFRGTTKLHGSNAGIAFDLTSVDAPFLAQSRERFLSPATAMDRSSDNFGFAAWAHGAGAEQIDILRAAVLEVVSQNLLPDAQTVRVFGEWCGPSINGKTAIGQISDRWVLCEVLVTAADGSEQWLPIELLAKEYSMRLLTQKKADPGCQIFFTTDFDLFFIEIDFNDPASALASLEQQTIAVEERCPVAFALGKDGLGEGIVWSCMDPSWGRLQFKTKGAKHKGTRNAKLVDIAPEVLASRQAFVDAVLTESRLEQGFDLIQAQYGKVTLDHIGAFLKWVGMDIMKEEADTLQASRLERKDVMGLVNRQAKAWLTPRLALV